MKTQKTPIQVTKSGGPDIVERTFEFGVLVTQLCQRLDEKGE